MKKINKLSETFKDNLVNYPEKIYGGYTNTPTTEENYVEDKRYKTAGGCVNGQPYSNDKMKTDQLGNLIWVKFKMID